MSIIDSNARWEDEDKAMADYLDAQDAETAAVYDNEVYPTPAQERMMEADMRWEAAVRYLDSLHDLDADDWEAVGAEVGLTLPEAIKEAEAEVRKASDLLDQCAREAAAGA